MSACRRKRVRDGKLKFSGKEGEARLPSFLNESSRVPKKVGDGVFKLLANDIFQKKTISRAKRSLADADLVNTVPGYHLLWHHKH